MMEEQSKIFEQLWALAQEECGPEEATVLRERIAKEATVAQAWEEIMVTQLTLQSWSAEQPSLRFQQNVMERLAVRQAERELLTPWAKRLLVSGFAVMILGTAFLGGAAAGPPTGDGPSWLIALRRSVQAYLPKISWPSIELSGFGSLTPYLLLAMVGLILLLAVDRAVEVRALYPKQRS